MYINVCVCVCVLTNILMLQLDPPKQKFLTLPLGTKDPSLRLKSKTMLIVLYLIQSRIYMINMTHIILIQPTKCL